MSDRCLVLLDVELGNYGPSPFRFENMWITRMDFTIWWTDGGKMAKGKVGLLKSL